MLALDKQGLRLGMDARLMERLALAERHVREGACHVARQREIVAQLKGHSHDAASARDLLTQFEALQALTFPTGTDCEPSLRRYPFNDGRRIAANIAKLPEWLRS